MAIAQKSAISFGLVYIPIDLHAATRDVSVNFHQLHKDDMSRIRYKKVCSACGKEVAADDIVRGYEYEKDKYVVVTDEEIEKIKSPKDRTIAITSFVDVGEIDPLYYDKAYYASPQKGGDKALELLRRAMIESGKVAIGKTVIGSGEKPIAIVAREDGIVVQTLLCYDEVRDVLAVPHPEVNKAELDMAMRLIESMEQPFDPKSFADGFGDKLRSLIADKIAGKEIVTPKEERSGAVLDLMEALKASVKNAKASSPREKPSQAKSGARGKRSSGKSKKEA